MTAARLFTRKLPFLVAIIMLTCVTTVWLMRPAASTATPLPPSVYDRVIESGAIRCAYAEYPPFFHKDPNTSAFSGIAYEVMEKTGQALGLKIEWVEDVPWGSIIEGLVNDRYDAFCADLWATPARGKLIDFSQPIAYSILNAYGRSDDAGFAGDVTALNAPSVRIAILDGEMGDLVARSQFPQAKRIPLPQGADFSQLFLEVTSHKADVVFAEPSVVAQFEKTNPGQLQNLTPGHPIRVLPNTIAFRRNQPEFKSMIDHALQEIIDSGQMDAILKKYEPFPGSIGRVADSYKSGL